MLDKRQVSQEPREPPLPRKLTDTNVIVVEPPLNGGRLLTVLLTAIHSDSGSATFLHSPSSTRISFNFM